MGRYSGVGGTVVCVVIAVSCSGAGGAAPTPSTRPIKPTDRASPTTILAPLSTWSVTITATVTTPAGEAPFELRSSSPVTFRSLDQPVIATLVATAPEPLLISGSSDIFSARLSGTGVLDVAGPVCVESGAAFARRPCAGDPAVLPVGISYKDVTASKPTGPVLDATRLRIALDAKALQPGSYVLQEDVNWVPALAAVTVPSDTATVTIRFDATRTP